MSVEATNTALQKETLIWQQRNLVTDRDVVIRSVTAQSISQFRIKIMKKLFIAAMLTVASTTISAAETPRQQACAIIDGLLEGGSVKANEVAYEYFQWTTDKERAAMKNVLDPLKTWQFLDAKLFVLEGIEGAYEKLMIVAPAKGKVPVYFVLNFELIGKTMRLFSITFDGGIKGARKRGPIVPFPRKLDC